jgi:hypothetical protein
MFCEWFVYLEWVLRDAVHTIKEYPLRGATAIAIVAGCLVWMFVHTHNLIAAAPPKESPTPPPPAANKKMKRENRLLDWRLNK